MMEHFGENGERLQAVNYFPKHLLHRCQICLILCFDCVPMIIPYHLYFLRITKFSSMLHHGSVGRVHSKEFLYLLGIFCCFLLKKLYFHFFFFFFWWSIELPQQNINQPELMISNCQWNCMTKAIPIPQLKL